MDREQQLEDELEEYKERVSELHVDIELLTSSLHKAQTTITVLKVSSCFCFILVFLSQKYLDFRNE